MDSEKKGLFEEAIKLYDLAKVTLAKSKIVHGPAHSLYI